MPKFVPRQRKHKVLARQQTTATVPSTQLPDSNQDILTATSKAEKEARRQQLRAELRAEQSKISSKKQKRLDKYIETKLRKDENRDYLRRLEKEKEKFDVRTVGLESSKNLNSKKRRFEDFVNGQTKTNGFVVEEVPRAAENAETHDQDDGSVASEDSFEADHKEAFDDDAIIPGSDAAWLAQRAPPVQGTGLAQPLQLGADGLPVIPMRAGKKRRKRTQELEADEQQGDDAEVSWDGFDSEPDDAGSTVSSQDSLEDDFSSESDVDSDDKSSDESEDDDDKSEDLSDSESSTSGDAQPDSKIRPRASAFKAWATQQLNQAVGHNPSYAANGEGELPVSRPKPAHSTSQQSKAEKKVTLVNGLPEVQGENSSRKVYSIMVERPEAMQESRAQLPIIQREQEIMEAIHNNPVVVIKGDTGSGKTTQIPQFLYEAGYGDPNGPTPGLIGITQPRRVAAVSMAKRVGDELGSHGSKVSHQIRFDSTVSSTTAIKFMTDGILLRELSQDLLLKKYSAIIIDEAHERSVNTDILIGMLSKIVPARMRKDKFNPDPKPLKLIIMSATLNIGDFLNDRLFASGSKPPIVEAEGRQHRVTTHFALRSRADYLEEIIEKVKRAHKKLPRGGILVFLTGKNEITEVQRRLRSDLAQSSGFLGSSSTQYQVRFAANETPLEAEDVELGFDYTKKWDEEDEIDILTQSDEEAEDNEFNVSDDEEEATNGNNQSNHPQISNKDPYDSVHILPLYSQLPTKEQLRVFDPPPDRSRLIVLSTNVAETSLTIPDIRFVFDCGRSKERKYDLETGVQRFEIDYISKASAQQRAGRAGRTGPGHCWRLYTSALFEQYFPEHADPEILRAPAEGVVLQVKGIGYPRPISDFPFPAAPSSETLDKAERLLGNLGALATTGKVTDLGKQLSNYPLSPRLGKILFTAITAQQVIGQAIALVAGLAVSDIYVNDVQFAGNEDDQDGDQDSRKQEFGRARAMLSRHDKHSDVIRLLTAVLMYTEASDKDEFCKQYFLRPKGMGEISLLIQQLRRIIQNNYPALQIPTSVKDSKKLSSAQVKQINNTAAAGYVDQIAVRWDRAPNPPTLPGKPRRTIDVPYIPLVPLRSSGSGDLVDRAVFIHPTSVLSRLTMKELPQYIVYTHLQQAQPSTITGGSIPKTRMFPLTPIDETSLLRLVRETALVEYGKPVPKTQIEDLKGLPRRRICWLSTELKGGTAGSFGWPMPPTRVRQVMDVKSSSGWRIEEVLS